MVQVQARQGSHVGKRGQQAARVALPIQLRRGSLQCAQLWGSRQHVPVALRQCAWWSVDSQSDTPFHLAYYWLISIHVLLCPRLPLSFELSFQEYTNPPPR